MKVIFLDIDGVLNSNDTCKEWHDKTGKGGYGGHFRETETATKENLKWGEDLFLNLKSIVDATGANIVISSTWRKYFSIEKFKEMFAVYGWSDAPIIDRTVNQFDRYRGEEVQKWMEGKDIESYIILDDDTDFLEHQFPCFVNTNMMVGLSEADAKTAIEILNK